MNCHQHETAHIEDSTLGDGSYVGIGSILRKGVHGGRECSIGDYVVMEGPVAVSDHVTVGPHCWISGQFGGAVTINRSVTIGGHVTITGPAVIGDCAIVESGAVVTRNVPPNAVVGGNPARIIRYRQSPGAPALPKDPIEPGGVAATKVRGVTLHHLPRIEDLRGNLTFAEIGRQVPFEVRRYFLTFDVAGEEARGEHAHSVCRQFVLCVHGKVHFVADDGENHQEFILDRPNLALDIPPMVWGIQYRFSPGAVLLVLCSDYYDPSDYIRDYGDFRSRAVKNGDEL